MGKGMISQFSKALAKLDSSRGMLAPLSKLLAKSEVVGTLPWKPTIAVIASGFALATVVSVVLGQIILNNSTKSKNFEPVTATELIIGEASINRTAVKDIIRRNIFNSEGKTAEDAPEEGSDPKNTATDVAVKTTLPIKVLGIIYGGDSTSGIAVVEDTAKQSTNSFMYLDVISKGSVVLEIQEDRIIIDHDGSKEFAEVYREEAKKLRRKKAGGPAVKDANAELSPLATTPPPPAFKEEGFEREKGKITMSQDFKQRMLTVDFAKVLQDAKAEPHIVDGQLRGFKLTRIRQDSFWEKAGLQNDDVVTEINGTGLTDTGQAIKLLRSIKEEPSFELRYDRGGTSMNLTVEIRS
jgi:general secretion pathway protein C